MTDAQAAQDSLPVPDATQDLGDDAPLVAKVETVIEARKRELAELRVLANRLDSFDPAAQKRIVRWLSEHYLG